MEVLWAQFCEAVRQDFADLSGGAAAAHIVVRMLAGACLGGLLGVEREEGKSAGSAKNLSHPRGVDRSERKS